ncbi:MAG TPA: ATP-binding cassette domain-containing protein [Bacillota bacterium]|nr:ATP-binding cassette domain-containing protein [Bacillota bacterium]
MNAIIEVKDFVKQYNNFTAVKGISFQVEAGTTFAFLGPNGAGKSTTISTLCTITDKTSGVLRIDKKDIATNQNEVRNVIGVVFQDSTLDPQMTVMENLHMHCVFYGIPKPLIQERIQFVLEIIDLVKWKKTIVSHLSGGMKRRVEIARGLLHLPKVLFLDEPTTGLDPQTRASIWEYIKKLQKENDMTIFLTTHYMEEAEFCDQVAIIDHGEIIAFDSPENLKEQYTTDTAFIISKDKSALSELLELHGLSYKRTTEAFLIELEEQAILLDVLSVHKESIEAFEVKKGTLNDVFLELTGRDIREG